MPPLSRDDAPAARYDKLKSALRQPDHTMVYSGVFSSRVAPAALPPPSLYDDHAGQREFIAVRRVQLERCLREVIARAMRDDGGTVTELARDCMLALDAAAAEEG